MEHVLTMTNLKLKPSLFTPALMHRTSLNQISIILLFSVDVQGMITIVACAGGGSSLFFVSMAHRAITFLDPTKGVICFCEVFCW